MFDVGNLITIGIVILVLVLFRLMDRGSRSLDKARKYADRIKEDITTFINEKETTIKGYRIDLEVERKAAGELMRRIQALTRDELAQKVQAISQIDERIQMYDTSLEELAHMTGRVQENLTRIRDESDFVETVGKRLSDMKDRLEQTESDLASISEKAEEIDRYFGERNAAALDKAVDTAVASARSLVLDFETNAQTLERKVEEHREAVERLEKSREARLSRDEDRIEKLLTEAIDRAGNRADRVEEAALAKLRDQAQDRVNLIRANFEEKIKSVQDTIKTKFGEIQDHLKNSREEWKAEAAAMNARQKAYDEDWKKDLHELTTYAKNQQEEWNKDIRQFTSLVHQQAEELGGTIKKQREEWEIITQNTGQEIIAATERRLEEYRQAQEEQFTQLSGAISDTAKLEAELRNQMQETVNRVNAGWESAIGEFKGHLAAIREDLAGVDQELLGIKEKSFDNVSKKLQGFEDEFLANLSKRSAEIDSQLTAWHEGLDNKLELITVDADAKRKEAEARISGDLMKEVAAQSGRIMGDMEQLKAETSTFEESIRGKIRETDEFRKHFNEQITAAKTSLEEIRKEIAAQIKHIEKTDALKLEMDHHMEDMSSHIDRIALLKNEIARIETQVTEIKRLEDDVNAKMTRFLSEKRRIEVMESDFNRLIQTSQSVEEKLAQVSSSDDVLQTMQVQLRRLEDVIKETEEKYQRVERKSKTLQETNESIDRNFKTLQESEVTAKRVEEMISLLKTDLDSLQSSITALSSENERAKEAAEKLSTLDESVKWLERRIAEMNVARESLGRLATELQNLEKDAQTQLKLTRSLLDREEGKTSAQAGKTGEGAPPPRDRENIISLKRQGWKIDEIAKAMKISKGEVELILELGPKDA